MTDGDTLGLPELEGNTEYMWAAASFGAAERIPWLRSMGISARTMDRLRGVAAMFNHSGPYVDAATYAGMGWGLFCEYATVIPLAAVIPAYQTGKELSEIEAWMVSALGGPYDLEWTRVANTGMFRLFRSKGIQSPVQTVAQFIRELYQWANPDLPDEYLDALIQHPDGVFVA